MSLEDFNQFIGQVVCNAQASEMQAIQIHCWTVIQEEGKISIDWGTGG